MSIWGILQMVDIAKQNNKEKKVQELLRQKGYPQDVIDFAVGVLAYTWPDDRNKAKVYKGGNIS